MLESQVAAANPPWLIGARSTSSSLCFLIEISSITQYFICRYLYSLYICKCTSFYVYLHKTLLFSMYIYITKISQKTMANFCYRCTLKKVSKNCFSQKTPSSGIKIFSEISSNSQNFCKSPKSKVSVSNSFF